MREQEAHVLRAEQGLAAARLQALEEQSQLEQDRKEGDSLAAEMTQRRLSVLNGMELFGLYMLGREDRLVPGTKSVSKLVEKGRARIAEAARIVQEYPALGE